MQMQDQARLPPGLAPGNTQQLQVCDGSQEGHEQKQAGGGGKGGAGNNGAEHSSSSCNQGWLNNAAKIQDLFQDLVPYEELVRRTAAASEETSKQSTGRGKEKVDDNMQLLIPLAEVEELNPSVTTAEEKGMHWTSVVEYQLAKQDALESLESFVVAEEMAVEAQWKYYRAFQVLMRLIMLPTPTRKQMTQVGVGSEFCAAIAEFKAAQGEPEWIQRWRDGVSKHLQVEANFVQIEGMIAAAHDKFFQDLRNDEFRRVIDQWYKTLN